MRIDNKGAWTPGTYDNLDVVTLEGSSYMCVQDDTATEPTTLQGWEVLAAKGDTGPQGQQGVQGVKGEKGEKGEKGDTGPQGTHGIQGVKGDPFTYADFTESQIAELQRPATEAATRADKVTKDAQAAIAEVKATEAKLYPAAENVLKEKVNDTFVHVNDAFAGAALREITIEGACKQDGTPSPENPVPIEVIEHPVLLVTGKNLLKYPFAFSHDNSTVINGITYTDNGDGSVSVKGTATNTSYYNIDFTTNAKQLVGKVLSIEGVAVKNVAFNVNLFTSDTDFIPFLHTKTNVVKAKVPEQAKMLRVFISVYANDTVNETIWPNIVIADEDTSFTKYASQSQAFTLPAEHPYLAKLPDGTADEIVVDKDGNVKLVARVMRDTNVTQIAQFVQGQYYELKTSITAFASVNENYAAPVICNALPSRSSSSSSGTDGIYRTWTGIFVKDTSGHTKEEIESDLTKAMPLTIYAIIPTIIYQLGKISIPALPESVSNVWTDAEITPITGIEYVRDVNIVVSNLEKAIASITEG